MATLQMYFITNIDENGTGDDQSLFVEADSVESAIKHWREYYSAEVDDENVVPDFVYLAPDKTGKAGALAWRSDAVPLVGGLKL